MSKKKVFVCDFCGAENDGVSMYGFRGYHIRGFGSLSGNLIEECKIIHICESCRAYLKRRNVSVTPYMAARGSYDYVTNTYGPPTPKCSSCMRDIDRIHNPKYCGKCGSKIAWSDAGEDDENV
jgi:hypothetical protein